MYSGCKSTSAHDRTQGCQQLITGELENSSPDCTFAQALEDQAVAHADQLR